MNIETKNEENKNDKSNKYFKLGKISNLNIYDYSGRELSLSICQDYITILMYFGYMFS